MIANGQTWRQQLALGVTLALGACGGGSSDPARPPDSAAAPDIANVVTAAAPTIQEQQCQAQGWRREVVVAGGAPRLVLWKAPSGGEWPRGALVVMHGGGGTHTNFCVANVALTEPQVRFTTMALAAGFAVFLLDSSDQVTDSSGRLCGKVWDDQVNTRANLDLPYLEQVFASLIPSKRPGNARGEIFVTGLSSGGYMSVRAASRFGDRITAFAPVSSGDPYGWSRDCTPRAGDRSNVFGIAVDVETGRPISEIGACQSAGFPNERTWDGAASTTRPPYKLFHHDGDGIHDLSCVLKVAAQLNLHGYPQVPSFRIASTTREAAWHYWLDEYNAPMLDYFVSFIPARMSTVGPLYPW